MKEVKQSNWFAPRREQTGKGPALAEAPLKKKMKGLLALGLCLCLGLGLLPVPALAAVPSTKWTDVGNFDTSWYVGHESDTEFTLTTAAQLAGLVSIVGLWSIEDGRNNFYGKTVKLGADIDLSAHLWTSIGFADMWPFSGTFDGNGKTVKGLTITDNGENTGLFGYLSREGSIHSLRISGASLSVNAQEYSGIVGILTSNNDGGTIYDCAVSGSSISANAKQEMLLVGGLVGTNNGTVKNCGVQLASMTAGTEKAACIVGGIVGSNGRSGTVENCFADVDSATITVPDGATTAQYKLAATASHSYWDAATALTDSADPNAPTYTQCYAVTAEQIAGTGGGAIGQASDTYANTSSLVTALNGWAAANAGHSSWELKNGVPVQSVFVPTYLDIGVVPEQDKNSATGTLDADVKLHGQVQENVELLSVTLPATIPFILDVDNAGALNRVLSGTGTLTNRSDMGVTVTLTSVTDPDALLGKADLFLVPAPLPVSGNVALTVGTGKTDVLSTLAAQTGGVPATSTLKVDGAAKASVPSVGSDGDAFTVGLTLKVSKT